MSVLTDGYIVIKLSGINYPSLTLVDLPGIYQPKNEKDMGPVQVKDLILSTISAENCLIVHVLSLNTDLDNSSSRQICYQVDPFKKRTYTVFTQIDRCNPNFIEKNIKDELQSNEDGYIVCCRKSDSDNKTESLSEKDEMKLLESSKFKNLQQYKLGRKILWTNINQTLNTMVMSNLKPLLYSINQCLQILKNELNNYGRYSELPHHNYSKWQESITVYTGSLLKTVSIRDDLNKIYKMIIEYLPINYPLSIDRHKINDDMERLRGDSLLYTIGCEPVLKKYIKLGIDSIKDNLDQWIHHIKSIFVKYIKSSLLLDNEKYKLAGEAVLPELLESVDGVISKFKKEIDDTLLLIESRPHIHMTEDYEKLI